MDPLSAGITFSAGSAGAGGSAALLANPYTAAIAAIAAATAYGTSPTVRKKTNQFAKMGWEHFTNPFQHFGDGSEKDKFGRMLGGNGLGQGVWDGSGMNGMMDNSQPSGGMQGIKPLLDIAKNGTGQKAQQQGRQQNQNQMGMGYLDGGLTAPIPSGFINTVYPYPLPPQFPQYSRGPY